MKSSKSWSWEKRLFFFSIAAIVIGTPIGLAIGHWKTVPANRETNVRLLVYKPATVRNLATEFATYSDGDGIEIFAQPIATMLQFRDVFPEMEDKYYGFTVYKLVDPKHPKYEGFLLSKRILGNEMQKFRCVLHKYSSNEKFLVDTEFPKSMP